MSEWRILHQFEDLVVVQKPAGWLSVPGRQGAADGRPVLGLELQNSLGRRVFPIHRLDAEVGGLMLFALSSSAQVIASRWFERRLIRKEYQALTGPRDFSRWPENLPRRDQAIVEGRTELWSCRLLRGKKRSYESPHGDGAETEALCHGARAGGVAWTLWPLTGRPHQLRLELARHGFAIQGDRLYGSDVAWSGGGIALRAVGLDLRGVPEAERAGLPEDLRGEELFQ